MLEREIKDNMKRDNGDLYLLKFVGIGAVLFCLFMIIGSRFVTVGLGSKEETKTVQRESLGFQESKLRAKLEDATILGKFWNSKGHFIVVYNGTTKAPEIIEVYFSEWQYRRVGERY